jgi:chitodextrinase
VNVRPAHRRAVAVLLGPAVALGLATPAASAAPKPKPTTTTTTSPADRNAPTAPANLRVTGTTTTSASLAWDASTDNSGTFSYVVKQDGHLSWTVNQTQTSYTLTWLSPGRTYSFYVYAVDRDLNVSSTSNTVTATTQPDVTPPSAPVLSVTNVSPSQIWLTWTESTDEIWPSTVGYTIYVNGTPATSLNWINHREVSLRHLSPGTTFTLKVTARDGGGNATDSNAVTVTTPASNDTVPPTAPTNLHIESDQGCAEVWLAWTQSTDDVDPQSAIEYEVYVNGVLSPLAVDTGVGRSFAYGTISGMNSFVVKAVDRSGNTSAASNTATAELWPC